MKNVKTRSKIIIVLVIFILFICSEIYGSIATNKYDRIILTENAIVKHNGKKVFKGNVRKYKLQNIKSEDTYDIYMNIPENNIKKPALQFDNINTAVKVYVDGKKVWEIGSDTPKGGIVCHANNKVPLGNLKDKKEIRMNVRVMNGPTLTNLPEIKMMNTMDIDKDFLVSSVMNEFIAILLLLVAIIGIILVCMNGIKEIINRKLLVLSILSLVYSIIVLSWYQLLTVVSDNYVLDALLEYDTRFLMIALIGIYLYYDDINDKRKKRHLITPILILVYGFVVTILQIKRVAYVNDSMIVLLIMAIIVLTDAAITYFRIINKKDRIQLVAITMSAILVFAIVILFIYIVSPNYTVNLFKILPVSFCMVILTMYVEMIYGLYVNYLSQAKKQALEEMAYIDKLTGLGNRRGFEQYLKSHIRKNKVYKVYSFDLNGLKKVNDTYGHAAGDDLIRVFADELDNVFADGFCARMGGDEFVAIVENLPKYEGLLEMIRNFIYLKNTKGDTDYKINFSVGSAIYTPSKESIEDVIKEADKKMYKMKEQIKSIS